MCFIKDIYLSIQLIELGPSCLLGWGFHGEQRFSRKEGIVSATTSLYGDAQQILYKQLLVFLPLNRVPLKTPPSLAAWANGVLTVRPYKPRVSYAGISPSSQRLGGFKAVMVGVFTPQKSAETTNRGFFLLFL